jgi:hypothetical protein
VDPVPAAGSAYVYIGRVVVSPGVVSITSDKITRTIGHAFVPGTIAPTNSGSAGLFVGQYRHDTNLGLLYWDGDSWEPAALATSFAAPIAWGAAWEQFPTVPYGELVRFWKDPNGIVHLVGIARSLSAMATGQTIHMFTAPVGYRPAVTIVRHIFMGGSASAVPTYFRCDITSAGLVQILTAGGVTNANFAVFDLTWRTDNT